MIFLEIYEIIIPTMMEKSRNKDIKRSMVIDKIRSKMISITEQSNDGINSLPSGKYLGYHCTKHD